MEQLLACQGDLEEAVRRARPPQHPLWRAILADLERADALVVNSGFIKEQFVRLGVPAERLHVVYLGVDEPFFQRASAGPRRRPDGALRLLFAGRFEEAKGADTIMSALAEAGAEDWELVIAGPIPSAIRREHAALLDDSRVTPLGTVDRNRLADEMLRTDVFVFPSLAEGSARVVFEALACGCYVVTTPNAGSIVEDGVHGVLVPPSDPPALAEALRTASENRELVRDVGRSNAALISARFRQRDYGNGLAALYARLTAERAG
jgi:glycosyltransferase involved in cell wall biosynthesis